MKAAKRTAIALASIALAWSLPAAADEGWPLDDGDYVEVSGIEIDDGHALDYANHLAGMWRRGQEFAKTQGWITSYEVMVNVYPRKGEPDVYLLTRFARFADPAEERKRDDAYRAYMERTVAQMQSESGERAKYRTLGGSMLLREQRFRSK